jgi:carbonic anhydrase
VIGPVPDRSTDFIRDCQKGELGHSHTEPSNQAVVLNPELCESAVYAAKDICDDRTSKNKAFVQKVAVENVRLTVQALTERSPILRDLLVGKQLKLVGAMHDIATERVSFFG